MERQLRASTRSAAVQEEKTPLPLPVLPESLDVSASDASLTLQAQAVNLVPGIPPVPFLTCFSELRRFSNAKYSFLRGRI